MKETFFATLSPMLVLFCCMVIGYVLNKKKICPQNTAAVLSKLETTVLCPALIVSTFCRYCTVASLKLNAESVLYSLLAVGVAVGLSCLLSCAFAKKGYTRSIYKYALAFGNFGFMGYALVPAILGEEALYGYMLFCLPVNLAAYTWGATILIPDGIQKGSPLKKLLNPTVFAVALGMLLGLSGLSAHLPAFVTDTCDSLGSCMGPVAMVLTGFIVANYPLKEMVNKGRIYIAAVLRLFVLPAVFFTGLKLLGADRTTILMAFFVYATPLGLNTVVFPAAYGGDTTTGASMATISHTVCVLTIPLMFALLNIII